MQIGTKRNRSTGQHKRDTGSFSDHSKRSPSKSNRRQADTVSIVNAKRSYERYMTLARTAALTDDMIEIENFYQHAEHYLRQMREQAV
jgi:hypothetical protein